MLRKGSKYHVALFSTMAWYLWQRRNRLQMNQSVWPLQEIGNRAKGLVIEFFDANKQEARPRVQSPLVCWVLPEGDFYKVNYDAAMIGGCDKGLHWSCYCCFKSENWAASFRGNN